ncbi:hypothetical protein HDU76_010780 [Blyttiomyces sp. JEL0837]|nr:hypothetical protein HDU76_010780 [Blyttiomyces sp. JEL0837]
MWDVPQYGVGSVEVEQGDGEVEVNDKGLERVDNPGSVFHLWTTDMLKLFEIVTPKPEIVVIGTGAAMQPMPPMLKNYLHKLGIQVEVMSSRHAGSTYNLLLREGRRASTALLPNIPTSARTGQHLVKLSKEERFAIRDAQQ